MEEWKFGYVRGQEIVVFNETIYSFPIFGGYFLEDIKLEIKEGGTLRVMGSEICHDFYLHKTPEGKWKNEPVESEIKVRKVGLPWKRRTEKYLLGWVKTKTREPFDREFGNGWILERRGVK